MDYLDTGKISGKYIQTFSSSLLPVLYYVLYVFQIATLACFSQFVAACMSGSFSTHPCNLLFYTLSGIFLGMMFYLWDVIYTVYKDMKKQQNATPIHVITQLYFLEAKRPDSQKFCQDYLLD